MIKLKLKILQIIKDQTIIDIVSKLGVKNEISVSSQIVKNWGKFIDLCLPKDVKNIVIIVPESLDYNMIREEIRGIRKDVSVLVFRSSEVKDKLYILY